MKRLAIRSGWVLLIVVILFAHSTHAQEFDFVLYNGNQSYSSSLPNQTEKIYLDQYMSLYAANMATLYRGWANTFTVVGANLPSLGKPPSKSYAGVCLGAGFQHDVDWNDIGYRTQDADGEGMFDIIFFTTLPIDRFVSTENSKFWQDTDITLKFNSLIISISDARMHFSNIGLLLRKQIVQENHLLGRFVRFSGISISFGALYSLASAREDFVHNGYETDIPGKSQLPEITVVDERTNGTITVGAPANPDTRAYVYYPYIEFQHLSFQTCIKAYVNFLSFLDAFAGANLAFAPVNKIYSDVHSDINIRITDNQGLDDNYDGKMTIQGTTQANHFIPMAIFGVQFNFGRLKIPIGVSINSVTHTGSICTGPFISF